VSTTRRALLSWAGPVAVTALGGWLRFANLGNPRAFVFDETYYAKDGYSLLQFGYERDAVEEADQKILDAADPSAIQVFTEDPAFVVHPPVGKWLIAAGEGLYGMNPFGWRVAVALLGTLSILILARAVRRMTGSDVWGTVAGLLLAIDGMAIVTSRVAILDGMLMFFVLAAFALLLIDRDRSRGAGLTGHWLRPWRLAAAVSLGLACGVKWSGLWFVLAFGILTVAWDASYRHRNGTKWWRAWLQDLVPAAVTMGFVFLVTYLASWFGWFASDNAWSRNWAEGSGVLPSLASLGHYHQEMLNFHSNLDSDHPYKSSAFSWLLQARPTSFYYESPEGSASQCPSGTCSSAITALGNPIIWWAAILAVLHQIWRWIGHRDWRSAAALTGLAAGWLPWVFFPDRTIFSFYTIVFAPFLITALTLSLAAIANPQPQGSGWRDRRLRLALVTAFLLLCLWAAWYFYPIWSAELIDRDTWSSRMWLPSWV
jgi:dolichyl-phosphate-mannose-protein mannosyltransferase